MCEIQLSWWIVLNIINEKYFKIWEDMRTSGSNSDIWAATAENGPTRQIRNVSKGFLNTFVSPLNVCKFMKDWGSLGEIDINKGELSSEIKYKTPQPRGEVYVLRKPLMVEVGWVNLSRSKRRWYRGGAFLYTRSLLGVMSGFLPHVKPSSVSVGLLHPKARSASFRGGIWKKSKNLVTEIYLYWNLEQSNIAKLYTFPEICFSFV